MSPASERRVARCISAVLVATAVVFTTRAAWLTARHCYFIGDDFSTLWRFRISPFGEALLVPLGGQVVPLHRLVAWVVDAAARMNFIVAWAVLVGWHILGVLYLYRLLQLIRPARSNLPLVVLYCVHPLIAVHFCWFSSGLTRLPCVALSLVAMRAFLAHRSRPSRGHLVVAFVAFLAALGFYAKAILIPVYCVGLDVLLDYLSRRPSPWRVSRPRLLCASAMVATSIAYALAARHLVGANEGQMNTDPLFQLSYQWLTWTVSLNAILGRVLELRSYSPSLLVPILFGGALVVSCYLCRRLIAAWLALIAFVSASFGVIGLSVRTLTYGGLVAFELRYHFEVLFILVVCLGIIAHHSTERLHRLLGNRRGLALAAYGGAATALLTLAVVSNRASERQTSAYYPDMTRAKAFVTNLRHDVRTLRRTDPGAVIADGLFPRYLDYMDVDLLKYSQFVTTIGETASFAPRELASHHIDEQGHVVPR